MNWFRTTSANGDASKMAQSRSLVDQTMKSLSTKEEKIRVKRTTLSNTSVGTNNIRRFTTCKYRVRDSSHTIYHQCYALVMKPHFFNKISIKDHSTLSYVLLIILSLRTIKLDSQTVGASYDVKFRKPSKYYL